MGLNRIGCMAAGLTAGDRTGARFERAPKLSGRFAECSEAYAELFGEKLRLFPGSEMTALFNLVVVDEIGIGPLCPTPRSWIQLVRKYADGNRDGDAFGIEIPEFAPILPIETGTGKRRIRQPGDGDVVEDVVAREAFGFSLKDA